MVKILSSSQIVFFSIFFFSMAMTYAKLLCLNLQLDQRPSTNYMEKLQKYITPIMRGILIDWLVEVSSNS